MALLEEAKERLEANKNNSDKLTKAKEKQLKEEQELVEYLQQVVSERQDGLYDDDQEVHLSKKKKQLKRKADKLRLLQAKDFESYIETGEPLAHGSVFDR